MTLARNIVHHMDNRDGLAQLPPKCANLIIADPPYFQIKGDFDFVFKNFKEYLLFMRRQAELYKRVLADNGTLFLYGHAKRVAYLQVIFDRFFKLENNITWEKIDGQTRKNIDGFRSFAPVTERILFYSNEIVSINGESVYPVRDYIRAEILRVRGEINYKEINTVLGTATNGGGVASATLSLDKTEPSMITAEQYKKLQDWLNSFPAQAPPLPKEYSALRIEYENLRRPFDNYLKLTDVMRFSHEGHIAALYNHETIKPEALTRALINTCSRKGDLVVIPFAGSGTECAMSLKEGRDFIAFETDAEHAAEANARCNIQKQKLSLF